MSNVYTFIVLLYIYGVVCEKILLLEDSDNENETYADFDEVGSASDSTTRMKSTLYKIQKKYACYNQVKGNHVLEYGRKAWSFPRQDINLTLSYPSENLVRDPLGLHLVTGFEVILYMDGGDSKGYIIDGGVFQSSLRLQFDVKNITTLGYQFWLFGITTTSSFTQSTEYYNMCA